MDINSKINMSLDEIIKLKRTHNKAEKKGPATNVPKGRDNKKFGKLTGNAASPRKGVNARRIQKNKNTNNKSPTTARAKPMKKGAKPVNKKKPVTVNLNKATTKKLVQNLVKKALKTTGVRKTVKSARTRLTTRNMRRRVTAPAAAPARNAAVASRLSRVSNKSRVIRRPMHVVNQRSPRTVVVRGRGTPRFRQPIQAVQQRALRVVERRRAPVVIRRERIVAPVPTYRYLDRVPQESVIVRRVPVQRQRVVERFQERPVQRRVVYVERPQPQRVFVRNVQRDDRRFASSSSFLPEVIVRRGRGFGGHR
ncbi:hypothetical protein QR680_017371 [Steinernema hermaphroditum]|uniref:Uncharacterized protein n=1 Tax=Steinernema hermaphroditum TaxID=289476 RepID=A0AA39HFH0_9BILA|nr:hypothetical protein QR680_017371 [Steinernema hermaphroditum]